MNRIKLLDCTLRDGGSLNNWNFGKINIYRILEYLNKANIDIIEIGFLQNNIPNNPDFAISSDIMHFNNILKDIKHKSFKAVLMIDINKYDAEQLPDKKETLIDGIRLMFKKSQLNKAVEYAGIIKKRGFELSLNPVSITTYNDNDLINLFNTANNIMPEIIYIVDTYGLMNKKETLDYFNKFNKNLNENIDIGYHTHNNLQLAFSNSSEIINLSSKRNIVVDASLSGMGKRAGNTNTELIADYINNINKFNKYDINKILEAAETIIVPLLHNYSWGYSLIHYTAAINRCHSDYVTYLLNEKKLKLFEINNILNKIAKNEKLTFNKEYIDELIKRG